MEEVAINPQEIWNKEVCQKKVHEFMGFQKIKGKDSRAPCQKKMERILEKEFKIQRGEEINNQQTNCCRDPQQAKLKRRRYKHTH